MNHLVCLFTYRFRGPFSSDLDSGFLTGHEGILSSCMFGKFYIAGSWNANEINHLRSRNLSLPSSASGPWAHIAAQLPSTEDTGLGGAVRSAMCLLSTSSVCNCPKCQKQEGFAAELENKGGARHVEISDENMMLNINCYSRSAANWLLGDSPLFLSNLFVMPLTEFLWPVGCALVSKGGCSERTLGDTKKVTTFFLSCPLKISIFTFYNIPGIL